MKVILITDIKTKLSKEEVMRIAEKRASYFKRVPGLIKKFWTYDQKKNIYHGIFEFKDNKSAESYIKSDFAQKVSEAYNTITPVKIRILKILKEQN